VDDDGRYEVLRNDEDDMRPRRLREFMDGCCPVGTQLA
jgi:hypothetical protein